MPSFGDPAVLAPAPSVGKTPRMVYDWVGKEELCYKLYITENKSLEEIMEFFKVTQDFAPSKRAFQSQFANKWRFPSKHNAARSNEDLVARVGELWGKNTSQKDMMQILTQEGYELTDRALSKIRKDNEWTLRATNGMKPQRVALAKRPFPKEEEFQVPEISAEVVFKRNLHFQKLQADSDERLKNRTRRVRTIGWAGMGPDPPMEPRFPSEMTISQSKEQLALSKENYISLRNEFQTMCEVAGLTKKTLAGAEKWQAIKQDLIERCSFLQGVLSVDSGGVVDEGLKKRRMALDIICSDVTKKIRTSRNRVTIPDAKSAMGINPAQGSEIRRQFYQILLADHFTSKIEAGPQHWIELKELLITGSTILQEILVSDGSAAAEAELNRKKKALEVLCRDVMKRLRDDQTKLAKGLRANSGTGHSDDSAIVTNGRPSPDDQLSSSNEPALENEQSFPGQLLNHDGYPFETEYGTSKPQSQGHPSPRISDQNYNDMEIDPTLIHLGPDGEQAMSTYHPHHSIHASEPHPAPLTINAWFRVSDTSPQRLQPRIWLSPLPDPPTIDGIHAVTLSHYASSGVQIVKIEAHTRYLNSMTIDRDDELAVFLEHANRETPTFVFHFAPTM
ncbi:hypothetical protein MMC07_001014 [Pseudocyphellaria aurata]|nr:hypothetical protein [Pseudocyphellaria aurata]